MARAILRPHSFRAALNGPRGRLNLYSDGSCQWGDGEWDFISRPLEVVVIVRASIIMISRCGME